MENNQQNPETSKSLTNAQARRQFIADALKKAKEDLEAKAKELFPAANNGKPNVIVNRVGGIFIGGNVVMNGYITQLLYVIENAEEILDFAVENRDKLSWKSKTGTEADAVKAFTKALELQAKHKTMRELLSDEQPNTEEQPEAQNS